MGRTMGDGSLIGDFNLAQELVQIYSVSVFTAICLPNYVPYTVQALDKFGKSLYMKYFEILTIYPCNVYFFPCFPEAQII